MGGQCGARCARSLAGLLLEEEQDAGDGGDEADESQPAAGPAGARLGVHRDRLRGGRGDGRRRDAPRRGRGRLAPAHRARRLGARLVLLLGAVAPLLVTVAQLEARPAAFEALGAVGPSDGRNHDAHELLPLPFSGGCQNWPFSNIAHYNKSVKFLLEKDFRIRITILPR